MGCPITLNYELIDKSGNKIHDYNMFRMIWLTILKIISDIFYDISVQDAIIINN